MDEPDLLEGGWEMVRAEMQGESAPELVVNKTVLAFTGERYAVHFAGEVTDRGFFATDPAPTPRRLILRSVEGANAGRTLPCIYQLTGGRLRICFGLDGSAPTGFSAKAGEERYLATYRRQAN